VAIHNQTSRCRSVGTRRPAPDRQVVDRQFNPRRYDAAQGIQSFSARLRDQIDLDTLTSQLVSWSPSFSRRSSQPRHPSGSA
jgi:hypothetical protein